MRTPLRLLGGAVGDQRADEGRRVLCLLGFGDPAGADRPDRLVGDRDLDQPLSRHLGQALLDLVAQLALGVALIALGLGLADAEDRGEARVERRWNLERKCLVGLAEQFPPLGVPEHDAVNVQLREHRRARSLR